MDKRISYIQVCNSHLTCMWERFLGAWAPPIPAAPTPTSTSTSSLHPQNQGKQGSRNTRCSQRRWVLLSESLWGTNVTAAEPKPLQAQDGLGAPGCPGALSTDPSKHASRRVCAPLPIPLFLRTPYSLTLSRASASKVLIASFCNESPSWSRSWTTLAWRLHRTSLPGCPVDPMDLCNTVTSPVLFLDPISSPSHVPFLTKHPFPLGLCTCWSVTPQTSSLWPTLEPTRPSPSSPPCADSWKLFRFRLDLTPFCQDHTPSLGGELPGENLEPNAPSTGSDSSVPWGSPESGCCSFSFLLCRWHWHSPNAKSSGCISSSGEGMKAQNSGSRAQKKSKMFLQLSICYLNSLRKNYQLSSHSVSYSSKIGLDQMGNYHWFMTVTKAEILLCRQRSLWSKLWFFQ